MRQLIRLLLVAVVALPLSLQPGAAQDELPGEADRVAIIEVISRQLEAFQRDDGIAAFGYASPGIQGQFGDPGTFMAMVRSGYQPVYRPQSVAFVDVVMSPRGPVQRVLFVGPDGREVMAYYEMQRQPDGSWRINGVTLVDAPGASA